MTLITKGMGVILKGAKAVKKEFVSPTTNKPLYAAGAIAVGQKVVREKLKSKKKDK